MGGEKSNQDISSNGESTVYGTAVNGKYGLCSANWKNITTGTPEWGWGALRGVDDTLGTCFPTHPASTR